MLAILLYQLVLRSEGINGNSTYYKLVAQQVFNKINELGYFK